MQGTLHEILICLQLNTAGSVPWLPRILQSTGTLAALNSHGLMWRGCLERSVLDRPRRRLRPFNADMWSQARNDSTFYMCEQSGQILLPLPTFPAGCDGSCSFPPLIVWLQSFLWTRELFMMRSSMLVPGFWTVQLNPERQRPHRPSHPW